MNRKVYILLSWLSGSAWNYFDQGSNPLNLTSKRRHADNLFSENLFGLKWFIFYQENGQKENNIIMA